MPMTHKTPNRLDYLRTSRPTAVNLANACDALKTTISGEESREGSTGSSIIEAFVTAAEAMLEEDVAANRRQGQENFVPRFFCGLCVCIYISGILLLIVSFLITLFFYQS